MKSLLPLKYHSYIFIFSLILLVVGLPLSKFLLSLSQIILACNWILEGNLKNKFSSFFRNKAALAASSLLLLHFFGLFYTSDFDYAFKDIRIKLPLFVLPLILSTSPELSLKTRHLILKFFVAAITVSTIISTLVLSDVIHRQITDIRSVSIFISHVRLALLICISIFICIWLFIHPSERRWRIIYAVLIAWFFIFLFLIESITGISVLGISGLIFLLYKISEIKNAVFRFSVFLGILAGVMWMGYMAYAFYQSSAVADKIDESKLDKYTAHGNPYQHSSLLNAPTENGHYVWIYYCEKELKEEWPKRSKIDFNWRNMRGDAIRYTLVRFMTSKNLRKDAEGMKQLSDEDIRAIEKGIANVNYMSSVKGRVYEIIWEIQLYNKTGEADGHSITQRFEYWKAALGIIAGNPVLGVGTGDIQNAFTKQYEKNNTKLSKEWRLRSHNQYLSITVAFGLFGLAWFLFSLIYPAIRLRRFSDFLYASFFIVALISFFTEDTLETQVGVTFYAFFNAFFLFIHNPRKD